MRKLVAAVLLLSAVPLAAANQFSERRMRAHMAFLASDLLEGRGAATRGHEVAAEYVAAQFAAAGLQPGAGASYFQQVPFRRTFARPESTVTLTRSGAAPLTFHLGEEFATTGDPLQPDRDIEAEVVFAGFGVIAPEQDYDDYRDVNVRGKIVAIFGSAPKTFPSTLRAHHSSSLQKIENAVARGAIGVILLSTPKDAARFSWERVVRQSRLGAMHWLRGDGGPHAVAPSLSSSVSFSEKGMQALFEGSKFPLAGVLAAVESGAPKPFPLPVRARIRLVSRHEQTRSANVVGLLRGSDPKLRDEYIVYSGHLDHLGISDPVDGDSINNGAFDNASGIAAMLEIARALANESPRPKRSFLFVATTAEEKGLRGADYFANNPTVPPAQVVADINVDQIQMVTTVRDIIAMGAQHTDLGDHAGAVAKAMNVEISADPYPDENFFVRSDQYPFVKQGIPAIYIGAGYKAPDGASVLETQQAWLRSRYHTPKDEMDQPMDLSVGTLVAEFSYRLGRAVANAPKRPAWKENDFFGKTFGKR
jgi:Zn-dependent M28 family amino/carboxypeptidase